MSKTVHAVPPARLLRHPLGLFGLGFGSGLSPRAPGTLGSLIALALWWLFLQAQPAWPIQFLAVLASVPLCIWAAQWTAERLSVKDPRCVVSDEFAGQWLVLLVVPPSWPWWLAAFVLFRVFDIAKPWPMPRLERLPGGVGIVADDLMAGIYAAALLLLAQLL